VQCHRSARAPYQARRHANPHLPSFRPVPPLGPGACVRRAVMSLTPMPHARFLAQGRATPHLLPCYPAPCLGMQQLICYPAPPLCPGPRACVYRAEMCPNPHHTLLPRPPCSGPRACVHRAEMSSPTGGPGRRPAATRSDASRTATATAQRADSPRQWSARCPPEFVTLVCSWTIFPICGEFWPDSDGTLPIRGRYRRGGVSARTHSAECQRSSVTRSLTSLCVAFASIVCQGKGWELRII
jgi:hypothetical protein